MVQISILELHFTYLEAGSAVFIQFFNIFVIFLEKKQ